MIKCDSRGHSCGLDFGQHDGQHYVRAVAGRGYLSCGRRPRSRCSAALADARTSLYDHTPAVYLRRRTRIGPVGGCLPRWYAVSCTNYAHSSDAEKDERERAVKAPPKAPRESRKPRPARAAPERRSAYPPLPPIHALRGARGGRCTIISYLEGVPAHCDSVVVHGCARAAHSHRLSRGEDAE